MNLTDKAMLVSFSISQWSAKKYDKKASKEIADNHGMKDATLGRYNKVLVAKKAIAEISNIASAARIEFNSITLPWRDDGTRILNSAAYFKLLELERKWRAKFEPAVKNFIQNYEALKEQAKVDLNGLYNEDDYPSTSEIENKFGFAFHVLPLPDANDFRVKLSDDDVQLIKAQINAENDKVFKNAVHDIWIRMHKVLKTMSDKLKAYKITNDGVEKSFHATLITNMQDLLDIIPILNITNDAAINQFAAQMSTLCKYNAKQLKENDTRRELVSKAADDILAKMAQFV